MKLSNETILKTVNALGSLNEAQLPIKVAYAISKNINKIDCELKAYNSEKAKLIEKYAEKDEEGKVKADEYGNINIKVDCIEDWNRDIKELLSIENEINIHMIQVDDLLNADYNVSPTDLSAISFMIND